MFAALKRWLAPGKPLAAPKIVGLVAARNEGAKLGFCLRALSRLTDAIVYLDDASDDGETLELVEGLAGECGVAEILTKEEWHRDEPGDRNRQLAAGRAMGGTHFVVIDADEAFTANCLEGDYLREEIVRLRPGEQMAAHWIQLWRGVEHYRSDASVWSGKWKKVVFCDDGVAHYESDFIHTSRVPRLGSKKKRKLGASYGLLHFQFVNWRNLLVKQAWYRCLERVRDPGKPAQLLNEKYGASKDETGLGLKPAPDCWLDGYGDFDPAVFDLPDTWREEQIGGWFKTYGAARFEGLDIWDIDWSNPHIRRGEGV